MLRARLVAVVAAGLSAAACSYNSTTTATVPTGAGPVYVSSASAQACVEYGFPPGTIGYDRCVQREQEARARGRVSRDYAEAQLAADARGACYSYGLQPGTTPYDRCVGRELEARRWRADQAYAVPVTPGTVVYTVPPAPEYVPPAPPPPQAGVQAFKDEFGFRYDGLGNRLDAHGNIISPQSTQP